jgi:hypothetical protein
MKKLRSSTTREEESADEPLDNNRPGDHELSGKQDDRDDSGANSSPTSQVGRAKTGGGPESVLDPEETVREGWPIPDQRDVPSKWPEPTVD